MGVCSYVCVPMYMCVCEFLCVYVFAACGYQKYLLYIISKAGTKLIGIFLPLPPCAVGILGVLPHTWFNLLCIMKKIVYLVCVNKTV